MNRATNHVMQNVRQNANSKTSSSNILRKKCNTMAMTAQRYHAVTATISNAQTVQTVTATKAC